MGEEEEVVNLEIVPDAGDGNGSDDRVEEARGRNTTLLHAFVALGY